MRARSGSTTRGASAAHRIGGIVAYIVDSCPTLVIDNCTNKGTVVSNMNGNCFIGGIAGVNYAAAIPGLHERSRGEIRAGQCRRRGLPLHRRHRGADVQWGEGHGVCQQGGRQLRQAAGDPHRRYRRYAQRQYDRRLLEQRRHQPWPIRRRPTTGRPQAASWVSTTARTARR